jgi:four helix bundle protein
MTSVRSFKELEVWQTAMDMAVAVYEVTKSFPASEQFGLTAQARRAAVSVPANIAEGHRRTRPGYINHVQIALGSLAEVETHVLLALRLRICRDSDAAPAQELVGRVGQMLYALLRSLRS